MFISGSLKDKTVSFYKEQMTGFNNDGFDFETGYLSYKGELVFLPWEKDLTHILERREVSHLKSLEERILGLYKSNGRCGTEYVYVTSEVIKIFKKIEKLSTDMRYAVMETLYTSLNSNNNTFDGLSSVGYLVDYLSEYSHALSQADLDATLNLFIKGSKYSEEEVKKYKKNIFNIDEFRIEDSRILEIYHLGEFIAPKRLSIIGRDLQREEEISKSIAPIYFTFKDDKEASKFLSLCKTPYLDSEVIEENAKKCNVSKSVLEMIKKIN